MRRFSRLLRLTDASFRRRNAQGRDRVFVCALRRAAFPRLKPSMPPFWGPLARGTPTRPLSSSHRFRKGGHTRPTGSTWIGEHPRAAWSPAIRTGWKRPVRPNRGELRGPKTSSRRAGPPAARGAKFEVPPASPGSMTNAKRQERRVLLPDGIRMPVATPPTSVPAEGQTSQGSRTCAPSRRRNHPCETMSSRAPEERSCRHATGGPYAPGIDPPT
eukprot:scaffold348_cov329-Pavlova_lutheri.AAC.45